MCLCGRGERPGAEPHPSPPPSLSEDLVLSFNRQRYIVHAGGQPRQALRGETVTVVTYPDQSVELLHGEEVPPFKVLDPDRKVTTLDFLSLRIVPVITFSHN